MIHNDLQGLNLGDYIHLTQAEKNKFDNLESSTSIIRQEFNYTGGVQIFTLLNNYSQIFSVEVQGQGALSLSQYSLIAPNQIQILDTLGLGNYLVILYGQASIGISPYYTQAQTDALIANISPIDDITKTSGEIISAGMAVVIETNGLVYKYDIFNYNHAGLSCGIAKTSGIPAGIITIKLASKILTEVGSGWLAGNSYFVGANSLLTIIPPIVGIVKKIATGIGIDTVIVENYTEHILI